MTLTNHRRDNQNRNKQANNGSDGVRNAGVLSACDLHTSHDHANQRNKKTHKDNRQTDRVFVFLNEWATRHDCGPALVFAHLVPLASYHLDRIGESVCRSFQDVFLLRVFVPTANLKALKFCGLHGFSFVHPTQFIGKLQAQFCPTYTLNPNRHAYRAGVVA